MALAQDEFLVAASLLNVMKRSRLIGMLGLSFCCSCGTEIDAEQSAVEMAAALSLDGLTPAVPGDSSIAMGYAPGVIPAPAPGDAAIPLESGIAPGDLFTVLYSENDIEVGARVTGVVHSLHAELGDFVEAGAVLARLEDAIEVAALQAAEAELDLAQAEFARASALAEQNVTTPAELEQANFRFRTAGAHAADAIARLERTRVRAPFTGVVSRRFVGRGESVEEGDPLFRLTAMRPLRARVRVPELAATHVARGARLTLRSLDGRVVTATVSRVAPTVDAASGTVEVLVDVADPLGLRPGATVIARFEAP